MKKCTVPGCERKSLPGLKKGVCQFHWNQGNWGTEWAKKCRKEMKFILWNRKAERYPPTRDENNNIITDGCLGRLTFDNVYLSTYAEYPGELRPVDLKIGECIKGVVFRLSGEKGVYDIYRVE